MGYQKSLEPVFNTGFLVRNILVNCVRVLSIHEDNLVVEKLLFFLIIGDRYKRPVNGLSSYKF